MKTKNKITLCLLSLLIVVAVPVGLAIYRDVTRLSANSYAAWTTGNLIVEYLRTHDDQWPKGWNDLREAKVSLESQDKPIYWDFDQLPKMIAINWATDVRQLVKGLDRNARVPFRVVTKLDGSPVDARWGKDTEPNRQIYYYLRDKQRSQDRVEKPK